MAEPLLSCQVLVVGAGPSGAHCARRLAEAGLETLLIEQQPDWSVNDFSSGGTPLETLSRYDLPESVVGRFWHQLRVETTTEQGHWRSDRVQGVVLDFAALREFLAQACRRAGGSVLLGHRYLGRSALPGGGHQVRLKRRSDGEILTLRAEVIVDATGGARRVIYQPGEPRPAYQAAIGSELLVEVPEAVFEQWDNSLSFFLGHHWMPRGYGWIFPMQPNRLKVGVCWFLEPHALDLKTESYRFYLDQLLRERIGSDYRVLDTHGGRLDYCDSLTDRYHQGSLVAIGDAVSAVNFLGGEGIRPGLETGELAAARIAEYLGGDRRALARYERQVRQRFDRAWKLTARLGRQKYLVDPDAKIDRIVRLCQPLAAEDLVQILFHYRIHRLGKRLGRLVWLLLRGSVERRWQRWQARRASA